MIKKYPFHELREIFDEVLKIPERLDEMTIVELKELYFHLEDRKSSLWRIVEMRFNGEKEHRDYGTTKHLNYCKANCFQFGTSVSDLEYWIDVLHKKIYKLPRQINFNDKIFKDPESEHFFSLLFENWLCEKDVPVVALYYVYRIMSNKTPENTDATICKLPHATIVANQTKFAEYWNDTYKPIHPKNLGFTFKATGDVSIKTFGEIANTSKDIFHTRLNSVLGQIKS